MKLMVTIPCGIAAGMVSTARSTVVKERVMSQLDSQTNKRLSVPHSVWSLVR